MKLNIKRLHPDAIIPQYATDGAACFDLHAVALADEAESEKRGGWLAVQFPHGRAVTFRTGLAFEVPPGWALMIYSRSGHGFKNYVRLSNCVGVIDSDYRGEVMVRLANDHLLRPFEVSRGDRIAQVMLVQVPRVEIVEVDALSDTVRGAGGFGSTGA